MRDPKNTTDPTETLFLKMRVLLFFQWPLLSSVHIITVLSYSYCHIIIYKNETNTKPQNNSQWYWRGVPMKAPTRHREPTHCESVHYLQIRDLPSIDHRFHCTYS